MPDGVIGDDWWFGANLVGQTAGQARVLRRKARSPLRSVQSNPPVGNSPGQQAPLRRFVLL